MNYKPNENFYANKWLFAIYTNDDMLVETAKNKQELEKFFQRKFKDDTIYHSISRKRIMKVKGFKIYHIDIREKHNDVFAEEDEIFEKMLKPRCVDTKKYNAYRYNKNKEKWKAQKLKRFIEKQRGCL